MTRILSLFVMFMLFGVLAFAQARVVTGTVTDEKGVPVEAASVVLVGTRAGTRTDENGNFRLSNVAPNGVIRISGVSITSKELNSGTNSVVNFSVSRDNAGNNNLKEVTVTTTLGLRRQAKELGGAATTITSKTITQGKSVNAQQALNGKISGVSVTTTNSSVFENAKINIRGIRSLTGNNQPMLVIDGAPTPLSYLSSIAPEDIQAMTILKSSASAALYGPDAVNGVIVISTKRGSGDKLNVTFTSAVQFTKVAFFPKLQHGFGPGSTGDPGFPSLQDGSNPYVPYENQQFGEPFDGTTRDIGVRLEDGSIQSGSYSNLHANDKRNFYNTGLTIQNTVSISAKDFYASVDDAVIQGVVPGDKNRRTSFRFNSGKQYGKLGINYGINYILSNYDVVNENGVARSAGPTTYSGGIFFSVLQVGDNIPLAQYKDWKNNKFAQPSNYYNEFSQNPYWLIDNIRQTGRRDDIIGNLDLSYKLAPWLQANAKISTSAVVSSFQNNTAQLNLTDWALKNRIAVNQNRPGSVFTDQSLTSRINFDGYFNGDYAFGKNFGIKYVAGTNIRQNRFTDVSAGGNNLFVDGLYNVSVRSGDANLGGALFNIKRENNLYSVYGSLGLSLKDFAFVEFTGRNDWESRLLKKNRSFFYPAVSGSVILTDMIPSLKSNFLSYAKIRGAYSKSANVNLNPYATQTTYSPPAGFPYGNNVGVSTNSTIPDLNLKPETVLTTEAGFELGFLKNRINFEATYFNQDCRDQILSVSLPYTTGYQFALANAAQFKNYGVEMDLGLSPLINIGKARLDLKINGTYNNNKVQKTFLDKPVIIGGSSEFISSSGSSPTVNNIAEVGGPAFGFQLSDYERDPATGKVIVDALGNPTQSANLITKGRSLPLWVLGVTPSLTIGDISISMTWDYKGGHDFYSGLASDMDFSGISARSAEYNRKPFVFPNSVYSEGGKYVNNTTRLTSSGDNRFWANGNTNSSIATNYFASAGAIRLRELNVSYILPAAILRNSKTIKKLTFAIVGKNLFLFVPKSNQWGDPEFNYSSSNNTFGISSSFQSPSARLIGLNLTAAF